MRDLVRKTASPQSLPAPKPTCKSSASWLLPAFSIAERLGNTAARLLVHPSSFEVAKEASYQIKKAAVKPTKKPRKKLQLPKTEIRSKAKKAHKALKTTTGKLAAGQAVLAIAVVTALVSQQNTGSGQIQTLQSSSENTPIQRYLPSIASDDSSSSPAKVLAEATSSSTPLYAWVTPWNLDSYSDASASYEGHSAFWATLGEDGITVKETANWEIWDTFTKNHPVQGKRYLTITANPNYSYLTITDSNIQTQHINALLDTVIEHSFDGIDIDYEGLSSENSDGFTSFISNLSSAFHAKDKLVAVTVEARLNNAVPMDWQKLSQQADEVRIMVYDYHSSKTDAPGPVAPIGWLKEVLDYAQATIDPSKLVVGLGNYGYDWIEPNSEEESWQGTGVSYDRAIAIAEEKQAPIVRMTGIDDRGYDIGSIPMLTYKDDSDRVHSLWFEDATSLADKVALTQQYRIKALIFWSVGLGDRAFWQSTTN